MCGKYSKLFNDVHRFVDLFLSVLSDIFLVNSGPKFDKKKKARITLEADINKKNYVIEFLPTHDIIKEPKEKS